jgi:hypothetical protein
VVEVEGRFGDLVEGTSFSDISQEIQNWSGCCLKKQTRNLIFFDS